MTSLKPQPSSGLSMYENSEDELGRGFAICYGPQILANDISDFLTGEDINKKSRFAKSEKFDKKTILSFKCTTAQ